MHDNNQTLTLDSQLYAMLDLPQGARDTLVSLKFVDVRLQQLRCEIAVSQMAHVAYAGALKAGLKQTPSKVSSVALSP